MSGFKLLIGGKLVEGDRTLDVVNPATEKVYAAKGAFPAWAATTIETGSIRVKQHLNIGPHIPTSEFKSSGVGIEESQEGLDEFTQMKVINIAK